MGREWSRYRVAQLEEEGCLLVEDGNHGEYRPRPTEFGAGETAFIRAADIANGRVLFETAEQINQTALDRIRKGIGRGGDVLFSHKGTVGKLALVPLDAPPFVCSPQTTFWRSLDDSRLDRRFLYYFLSSREFSEQWQARKGETDMADYVSLTAQRELRVAVPHITEQKAIAQVLGALDGKIELNQRLNRTLEAIGQATFKSWFVDFDPVTSKAAGRQPFGMDAATAALFPEHFVDSSLGQVPAGWRVSRIGDEVTVVGGSTPSTMEPKYWEGGTICWVTPRDLSRLTDPVLLNSERCITPTGLQQISSGLLPRGTVLLSSRAPIGYLAITQVPAAVNQGFVAMLCQKELSNHYVLQWTTENMEEILARSGGTTFAEISKASFRPIPVLVPDKPLLGAFHAVTDPLHKRIVESLRESAVLAALRDSLLPTLFSEKIRVSEAEKEVERAGA